MPKKVDNEKKRIGICGYGSIGSRHARLLSYGGDVDLVIADPVEGHLKDAEKLPSVIAVARSAEEIVKMGLHGLIIATPDEFHVPQAELACRAGVPVLIEKPVADNLENAERLKKIEKETGAAILVGYPLRHNAVFQKGKEILDSGRIGCPVSFHIMLGAYATLLAAKNRFAEGVRNKLFVDYSHEWDYLHWFLGDVDKVAATAQMAGKLELMQDPNIVNAVMTLKNGVSGTAHLDYVQFPGQREFVIIGDRGRLGINAVQGTVTARIYDEEYEQIYSIAETFDGMMTKQWEHFRDIIFNGKEAGVKLDDGINALRTADAMIRSVETGMWQKV